MLSISKRCRSNAMRSRRGEFFFSSTHDRCVSGRRNGGILGHAPPTRSGHSATKAIVEGAEVYASSLTTSSSAGV
jgi:hypothetical protein